MKYCPSKPLSLAFLGIILLLASLMVGCDDPQKYADLPPYPQTAERTEADPSETTERADQALNKEKIVMSEEQWREKLTEEQYRVAREAGTERAFTGKYWDTKTPGVYKCVCCGQPLFSSEHKYDSGSGWPSYDRPIDPENVEEKTDRSHGMTRTEVVCSRCDAHLGHVFNDGPRQTTGLRYCINSASLTHEPSQP